MLTRSLWTSHIDCLAVAVKAVARAADHLSQSSTETHAGRGRWAIRLRYVSHVRCEEEPSGEVAGLLAELYCL